MAILIDKIRSVWRRGKGKVAATGLSPSRAGLAFGGSVSRLYLKNNHGVADADLIFQANDVPVGDANATVTGGAPDGFGIVGAMNSDARFVETHPHYADQIIRSRWQIVILLAT